MNKLVFALVFIMFGVTISQADSYDKTVDSWSSPEDVSTWLKNKWEFSSSDATRVAYKIRTEGPQVIKAKSAEDTFNNPIGWCKDSANFAKETLNKMDEEYKAGYIFIKNKLGPPNHWVTGYRYKGKIYVVDYGAGSHWSDMMGTHGPYDTLEEYEDFLKTINHNNFQLEEVMWYGKGPGGKKSGNKMAKLRMKKFDKNGDGKISYKEAPPPMKNNFENLDADGSEYLNIEELSAISK